MRSFGSAYGASLTTIHGIRRAGSLPWHGPQGASSLTDDSLRQTIAVARIDKVKA